MHQNMLFSGHVLWMYLNIERLNAYIIFFFFGTIWLLWISQELPFTFTLWNASLSNLSAPQVTHWPWTKWAPVGYWRLSRKLAILWWFLTSSCLPPNLPPTNPPSVQLLCKPETWELICLWDFLIQLLHFIETKAQTEEEQWTFLVFSPVLFL